MGDVFNAMGDPLRRQLIEQLVDEGPQTATQLARSYELTRQAIIRHLGTLLDCGVVTATRYGNEVRYEVQPEALASATAWIERVAHRWDVRANALQKLTADRTTRRASKAGASRKIR